MLSYKIIPIAVFIIMALSNFANANESCSTIVEDEDFGISFHTPDGNVIKQYFFVRHGPKDLAIGSYILNTRCNTVTEKKGNDFVPVSYDVAEVKDSTGKLIRKYTGIFGEDNCSSFHDIGNGFYLTRKTFSSDGHYYIFDGNAGKFLGEISANTPSPGAYRSFSFKIITGKGSHPQYLPCDNRSRLLAMKSDEPVQEPSIEQRQKIAEEELQAAIKAATERYLVESGKSIADVREIDDATIREVEQEHAVPICSADANQGAFCSYDGYHGMNSVSILSK